jgi:pyridoxal phosphate enzyme (YggS family)
MRRATPRPRASREGARAQGVSAAGEIAWAMACGRYETSMPETVNAAIAQRVAQVRAAIAAACARAGRQPGEVRLIAVTKASDAPVLPALAAAGIRDFGENRLDHLALMRASAPAPAVFHAIGRIQSRQLAELAGLCEVLHSLCDEGHILRLERVLAPMGRRLPVFLQVNVADDAAKAGVSVAELPQRLALARAQPHLDVIGLMTMAPLVDGSSDGAAARRAFAGLRTLAQRHGLARLSMGMTDDFTVAVEEGATDVRIGRALVP